MSLHTLKHNCLTQQINKNWIFGHVTLSIDFSKDMVPISPTFNGCKKMVNFDLFVQKNQLPTKLGFSQMYNQQ
jgi:hypothetical protein